MAAELDRLRHQPAPYKESAESWDSSDDDSDCGFTYVEASEEDDYIESRSE
ncbi:Lanosterol synthase [Venturia inaequalis]|nr:Lanosterol synthase [Venturia inaequalis]